MANSTGNQDGSLGTAVDVLGVTETLYVVDPSNGSLIQLFPTALTWEEQTGEFAVRVSATVPNMQLAQGWVHQLIALAGVIYVYADWGQGPTEVVRATVWQWKFEDNGTETVSFTAYDRLMYLQKSKDSKAYNLSVDDYGQFSPTTPADNVQTPITGGAIIDDLARRWGFSVSGTDLLRTILPKLVWQQTPLSQMFSDILNKTYWLGGGAFLLRSRQDQIEVLPPATNTPIYALDLSTIEQFSDEQDMQDLVTRVVVLGMQGAAVATDTPVNDPNDWLVPIQGILDGATQYGVMQDIIQYVGAVSGYDLGQLARQTLQNRGQPRRVQRFDAPDLPFLRRGDAIGVTAGTLTGLFIITGISHDYAQKRMQITIDTSGDLTDPSVNFVLESPDETAQGGINPYRQLPRSTS